MSAEHVCIEDQITALQKQVAELTKRLDDMRQTIVLRSPDGLKTITLAANDHTTGIWVDGGKRKGKASIYVSKLYPTGVVGVNGEADKDGKIRFGHDVALFCDDKTGGQVQLFTADNVLHTLEPKEAGEGTKLEYRPQGY